MSAVVDDALRPAPRRQPAQVRQPLLGDKDLHVSRARARMTLVTSFTADQLPEAGSQAAGYQLMRAFVQFATSGGVHLQGTAQPVPMNPFEREIYDRLTTAGMHLDPQYGVSGYRLDFAARHPDFDGATGPVRHILAVECDGRAWHSGWTAREPDRLRQQQLERLGWRFHRIWSTDWFRDPDTEVDRALETFNIAVERSRNGLHANQAVTLAGNCDSTAEKSTVAAEASRRPVPRWVSRGAQINTYSNQQLVSLVQWLRTDGVIRLRDDEIGELIAALGLQRRGPVIVARLGAALDTGDRAVQVGGQAKHSSARSHQRPWSVTSGSAEKRTLTMSGC